MIAPLEIDRAWMWSAWQPDRGMAFNSYLFEREGGMVAVDPLPLDETSVEWLASSGGVRTIVLTNRDHERDAATLRERFGARIVAHELEAERFTLAVDATFADGDEVFEDAFAIALAHGKTPGEIALHLASQNAAVVGDALIGSPAGSLSLLPDSKLEDPNKLLFTLRKLWALELNSLLLCDGAPIFHGADAVLGKFLETLGGAEINRMNVDEVQFEQYKDHPRYNSDSGEVGLLIGARKLGYRLARIEPGKAFCPLHSHEINEEFFYVIEGKPSIRTLRGTIQCRPGDFIAFPTGERGAHQVLNESDESCLVMLVGMEQAAEICEYPDSQKLLAVGENGMRRMVRSVPLLDYFDGE
jgi:uncharacterized cupin superfamily protein/glyoxylase-like metal-dependent hydrolase (beta-lactamase superfamily II)